LTTSYSVSDYAASKAFFLKALEPLGVAVVLRGRWVSSFVKGGGASLHVQTEEKPSHLT
jgi:hypothetical protein